MKSGKGDFELAGRRGQSLSGYYFFDDLMTKEIDAHEEYVGRPLMAHLEALADEESPGG